MRRLVIIVGLVAAAVAVPAAVGDSSVLDISPKQVKFGKHPFGTLLRETITLTNTGTSSVLVDIEPERCRTTFPPASRSRRARFRRTSCSVRARAARMSSCGSRRAASCGPSVGDAGRHRQGPGRRLGDRDAHRSPDCASRGAVACGARTELDLSLGGGERPSGVAGVDRPPWLDQQDVRLVFGLGTMLDASRHDEELAFA